MSMDSINRGDMAWVPRLVRGIWKRCIMINGQWYCNTNWNFPAEEIEDIQQSIKWAAEVRKGG